MQCLYKNNKMQTVSYKISILENVTKTFTQISAKLSSVNALFKKTDNTAKLLPNTIKGLETKLDELRLAQDKAFTVTDIKKYRTEIKKTEAELHQLNVAAGRVEAKSKTSFGNMKSHISTFTSGITAAIGVISGLGIGIGLIAKNIFETTAEMETYNAVLTNTFQSSKKAGTAMEMITKFAAKTPFQINTLTDAYVKLVNQGFIPTEEQMTSLGDLASSTGKDFGQLAEAILDAQTNEFERLKEFGIKAKKDGDTVKFTFKEVETTVAATSEEIQKYILSLGDIEGISGSMAAISNTLAGRISNLKDTFQQFGVSIGNVFSEGLQTKIVSIGKTLETVKPIVILILEQVKDLKLDFGISGGDILVKTLTTINNNFFVFKDLFNTIKTPIVEMFGSLKKLFGDDGSGLANLFKILSFTTKLALTPMMAIVKVITWVSDGISWLRDKFKSLGDMAGVVKIGLAAMFSPLLIIFAPIIAGIKLIQRALDNTTQSALKAVETISMMNDETTEVTEGGFTTEKKTVKNFRTVGVTKTTEGGFTLSPDEITTPTTDDIATPTSGDSKDIVGDTGTGGNRYLNITKLIEKIEINTTNLTEGASKIKEEIIKVVLAAVNDSYNAA